MKTNDATTPDLDGLLDTLAAELTDAVYPVALQHGQAGSWVDLELDLWHAVAHTVKHRARKLLEQVH
jgi:hypothetical protein